MWKLLKLGIIYASRGPSYASYNLKSLIHDKFITINWCLPFPREMRYSKMYCYLENIDIFCIRIRIKNDQRVYFQ